MENFFQRGGYDSMNRHMDIVQKLSELSNEPEFLQLSNAEHSLLRGETCNDLMEQMIAEEQPQLRILRLLCLQYMLSSNVDRDQFKKYRREMVQVYGFEMLFTFENLEKVGFLGNRLPEKQKRQDWRQLRTVFSLQKPQKQVAERNISVNSETGTVTDCDPNLVFNGCAPLSVKIVQAATTKNWKKYERVLEKCGIVDTPASTMRVRNESVATEESTASADDEQPDYLEKKVLIVYIIGGLTRAEIAGFRALSRRSDFPYHIICCTTNLIDGTGILKGLSVAFPHPNDKATRSPSSKKQPPTTAVNSGEER